MKYKIIAFTNLFPLPWEPRRAAFNRQQFNFLSKYFEMSVLVPIAWTNYFSAKWRKKNTSPLPSSEPVKVNYFVYFFVPRIFRWSYSATQFLSTLVFLPRFTGKRRPDLILATWVYPDAMTAVLIGKMLRIPVIVKVHGSDINENAALPGVRPQVTWTLRNASAVLTVSQDLANKAAQLGASEKSTKVIYNGVDLTKFSPKNTTACRISLQLPQQAAIILYVGNLKRAKGCLDLLEGFAQLLNLQPNARLVYVGEGHCADEIKDRADRLGINQSITLAGSQAHEKLPEWMGAADVVALPSHNEGVPNVLLEAMACGRPIVATAVGGIPEILPAFAGHLVARKDVAELSNKLYSALNQSWNSAEITAHAAKFSWERNILEFKELFKIAKGNIDA